MIGAKTVGPGFADRFRKIGVVVIYGFKRSHGGIGLKGLLHKIAKVDPLRKTFDFPDLTRTRRRGARTRRTLLSEPTPLLFLQ